MYLVPAPPPGLQPCGGGMCLMPPLPGSPKGEEDSPVPASHSSQCSHCWAASGKGVFTGTWLELRQQHFPGNLPALLHCLGVGPRTCQGNARELTQGAAGGKQKNPSHPLMKRGEEAAPSARWVALSARSVCVGGHSSPLTPAAHISGSHSRSPRLLFSP